LKLAPYAALEWTVMGRSVQHDRCGVTVRFEGEGGAYSGHGPTVMLLQSSGLKLYVPRSEFVNGMNPYHTKNWTQLVALVEEARTLFEGKL
jgi:hypothetical protein